jgi:hypothetical protein
MHTQIHFGASFNGCETGIKSLYKEPQYATALYINVELLIIIKCSPKSR